MPGKSGPKKGGNKKKKGKKGGFGFQRELITRGRVILDQESQGNIEGIYWYGRVDKINSGESLNVTMFKDNNETDTITVYVPKRLRRARPAKGNYMLLSIRQFNTSQADAVIFYKDDESKQLQKMKEIPRDTSDDGNGIVFVTKEEDANTNTKKLSKAERKQLRKQRKQNNDGQYLDLDGLFNENPSVNSLMSNFKDDELAQEALEFIKNTKTEDKTTVSNNDNSNNLDEDSSSESDGEIIIDVEDESDE